MKLINLHTHKNIISEAEIHIVNQYPIQFEQNIQTFSVGIHPWKIHSVDVTEELKIIESKLSLNHCLAIGECGLDKRIETPIDVQGQVFTKQLLLAQKHQKPVIIHCVAAFDELLAIKNKLEITVPLVIHGFSKNQQVAAQLIKNGFYLSIGKYFMQNDDFSKVLQTIPLNKLFFETDSSDFLIFEIYQKASKTLAISLQDLTQKIYTNFKTVFAT